VDVHAPGGSFEDLNVPLAGLHQGTNVALAVGILDVLARRFGLPLDGEALRRGLLAVRLPGRLETVRQDPPIVIDVAHNEAAMRASLDAIDAFFPHRRLHVTAGFSKDKDIRNILAALAPRASRLILTSAGGPRAADPEHLAALAREAGGREVLVKTPVSSAVDRVLADCGAGDLGLVTGSFYVAGKAYEHLGVDVGSAMGGVRGSGRFVAPGEDRRSAPGGPPWGRERG
jgi:dihydrofolate synthase/folylpolyglutamate synthase